MRLAAAIRELEECERKLRTIVAEAAADGDYSSVHRVTDWARAVASLATEGRATSEAGGASPDPASGKRPPVAAPITLTRHQNGDGYPKFFRRGDDLVRVGWSKKERKEYTQRAPRRVVEAAAAVVHRVGAKGQLFLGDAILPVKDPADGTAVPSYQAYVALGWLSEIGAVEQHGRRAGYTLVQGKQVDRAIASAWPKLAEWRG